MDEKSFVVAAIPAFNEEKTIVKMVLLAKDFRHLRFVDESLSGVSKSTACLLVWLRVFSYGYR